MPIPGMRVPEKHTARPRASSPRWVVFCASALLHVFAPSLASGQDQPSVEGSLYLAAADFLRELEPVAVIDEAHCHPDWRDIYGIPLRCPTRSSLRTRIALRTVAEELGLPSIAEVPACGPEAEIDARALQLSPVQFDTAVDAWFVVASSCATADGVMERLYLVQTHRVEAGWALPRTTLLGDSEG